MRVCAQLPRQKGHPQLWKELETLGHWFGIDTTFCPLRGLSWGKHFPLRNPDAFESRLWIYNMYVVQKVELKRLNWSLVQKSLGLQHRRMSDSPGGPFRKADYARTPLQRRENPTGKELRVEKWKWKDRWVTMKESAVSTNGAISSPGIWVTTASWKKQ